MLIDFVIICHKQCNYTIFNDIPRNLHHFKFFKIMFYILCKSFYFRHLFVLILQFFSGQLQVPARFSLLFETKKTIESFVKRYKDFKV